MMRQALSRQDKTPTQKKIGESEKCCKFSIKNIINEIFLGFYTVTLFSVLFRENYIKGIRLCKKKFIQMNL